MRTRRPLPAQLRADVFTSETARGIGVSPWRLRAGDLHHPFHSVHVCVAPGSIRELCEAYLPLLPAGACFSHQTAAALFGVPLPATSTDEPLHVSVEFPRTPPRGRGVVGHSLGSLSAEVIDGLPVCSAAQVWCQLAGVLDRNDLVAAGDHLVGARKRVPRAELGELVTMADELHRTKGTRARAWALPRIRYGADSRPETLLRLLLEDCGFSGLEVNRPVPVGRRRRALHPDLSVPSRRIAFEYEGDGHRVDQQQWYADIRRHDLLEAEGWRVVRVTARDLFHERGAFLARLETFVTNAGSERVKAGIRDES